MATSSGTSDFALAFHRFVARGAGNPILTRMRNLIQELLKAAPNGLRQTSDLIEHSNRNHHAPLDAFRSDDAEHVRVVTHRVLERIEDHRQSTLHTLAIDA